MRRRKETSKVVLATVLIVCFIFTGIVIYGWLVWDRTDAAGLAGVILAPAATAIGFYAWKAKAENQIKLKKRYGILNKNELEE
jgi:hypothetical protein